MAKTDLIVGLDVGSGKMTAIAAAHDKDTNTLKVLTGRSIVCRGLKGGVVSDIGETSTSVNALLGSIQRECEQNIGQLFVGVRGSHLASFSSHGSYNVSGPDTEIGQEDMDMAVENAKSVQIKSENEIVSVLPQGYFVDKQPVSNPEGMEGKSLEVDVQIVTGASTHLRNLAKSIQRPGFHVDGKFYGIIALAESVLTQDEKENGAMILDFGGETISVGLYIGGLLKFSCDIPYGCDVITNDLSRFLRTPSKSAREIKEKYGVAHPDFLREDVSIEVPLLDGSSTRSVKASEIVDIIQVRLEELLEQVERRSIAYGFKPQSLPLVGVITGGGSQMPGLPMLCMHMLGLKEVRCGTVQRDLITSDEEFFSPQYSTAMALTIYSSAGNSYEEMYDSGYSSGGSVLEKVGRFFKNILSN